MHVVMDAIAFEHNRVRGVQRYFNNLLPHLARDCRIQFLARRRPLQPLPAGVELAPLHYHRPRHGLNPFHFVQRELQARRLARIVGRPDLFHATYFTANPFPDVPEVVTIHDMVMERYPQAVAGSPVRRHEAKMRAIARARVLVAVSRFTADELVALCPQAAGRVIVTHPGADHFLAADPDADADPDDEGPRGDGPYVLHVGARHGYKNFGLILRAMQSAGWPGGLRLVAAGGPFGAGDVATVDAIGKVPGAAFAGHVDDRALRLLYRGAAALVFPSLYEGFGFPLLEAQALGAPVVCSDIPVFHETAGDSVLFCDPHDPAALAAAVRQAIEPSLAADLRQRGAANVRRFTWRHTAERTLAAYRRAIADHGYEAAR